VRPQSSPPMWLTSIICSAISLLFAVSSYAQKPGPSSGTGNQQNTQSREWALTHVREEVDSHFGRQQKPSLTQIREDFERLQIVNNELMKRVFVQKLLDPRPITTSIGEIKKRANRLRLSLAFGESGEQTETSNKRANSTPDQEIALSPTLLRLDRAIMSFVKNPLFQEPKLLDSKLAVQAHDDLDEVLRLTQVLNRLTTQQSNRK
jgi:hypothetical protein